MPAHCDESKQKSILCLQSSRVFSFSMAMTTRFATKFSQHSSSGASLIPILSSCYGFQPCNAPVISLRLFSSSTQPPPEVPNFKLPPPVNPPDPENPDRATLRAQWDHAVRMYARTYSHAWGTAILAGVSLFGLGWWIKGENPLKALSPTGELKKEETTD